MALRSSPREPVIRRREDLHATSPTVEGSGPEAVLRRRPATMTYGDTTSIGTPDYHTGPVGRSAPLLERVAQFVLLERLGAGGMGVVYAAFDEKLERKVAIKLVAARGSDERAQARLLREAQAQARLSHPNVVTVYEVGTLPDGPLFIAMELVKGPTLRAWQKDGARTWQQVVATYAAAGEGLAAAHRRGIVHRDFKPDNVLIGEDGRPRVADFGLAFAADPATPSDPRSSDAPVANARRDTDETPSTCDTQPGVAMPGSPDATHTPDAPGNGKAPAPSAAGSSSAPGTGGPPAPASRGPHALPTTAAARAAGTPGYMAPEQIARQAVDARTDQFAFCVALYEGLHGERPTADLDFASGERPARRRNAPDSPYPRWLWDVMMRGLAHEPSQRFASMDALLGELTRRRHRARKRALAVAVVVAVLATAGMTYALSHGERPPVCPEATAKLAGVWDAATKLRVQVALIGTGTPFAASVWASTEALFDRYANTWLAAQHAACEATHVQHVQSADLLDRRTECLEDRRRSLSAAAEVLQSRPTLAVAHASEILGSLGDIALCADTAVLLELGQHSAAATDPRTQAQVAAVRQHLAQAGALLAAGDITSAEPIVAKAGDLAKHLDGEPVRAEISYLDGRVKLARGNVAESIAVLNNAVELAVSSRHDELVADVYLTLVVSGGTRDLRPAETKSWLTNGEAWIRRLGHPSDSRRVALERARGMFQLTSGDPRTALITLSHALDIAEAMWGKTDPRLSPLLRDRAVVEARLRQAKPAVADGERALALGIQAWGSAYPEVARTRRALGMLYIEQLGDAKRGETELLAARELYRTQLGADSIEVANCEQGLSVAGQYRGDYAAALEHAERAEQIFAHQLGAGHPRHGETLMGLGVLRFMRRDFAGSLAADEAAYPILSAALGAEHVTVGILLSNTGESLLALDRAELAQDHFERALAILQKALDPDHADLALPLKGIGLAQLRRGRPREALAPLERALNLRNQSKAASDPQEVAEIQWGLARTLSALGRDPARARTLADAARAGYVALGSESAGRAQEISRWLHKRAVTP